MKKLYRIGCLLCTFFILHLGQAAPVDSLSVARVAATYLLQYAPQYEGLTCVAKRTNTAGDALYYVFNHGTDKGFIIVTADDVYFPILGYATEGRFAADNVPPQLTKWLLFRAGEINRVREKGLTASAEVSKLWQRLKSTSAARMAQPTAVAPLVTTNWNQAPYYNDLCPANAKGQRVVTGCVATAMAQLMKYHNHPQTGQGYFTYSSKNYGQLTANFGSTTYGWSSMPARLTSRNTAVATLMYHCGVSISMNYGLIDKDGNSSSGAYPKDAADALKKYFGYNTTTRLVSRKDYTESAWISLLKAELDAKRPMEYHGFGGESGHSFVCDGYNNDNLFHFNWGWGGQSDGYFYTNKLDPDKLGIGSGDGVYNDQQGAIIGIQPATAVSSVYNLQLNKKLTVTPSPIAFGDDITVSFNLTNQGTAGFQGDYSVAIFTADGDYVSDIGETKTNVSLPAGSKYTSDLTFTQKSVFLSEGTYQVAAFYREPQKEWKLIGSSSVQNIVQVTAQGVDNTLKMYKTPLQVSAAPIVQNEAFNVTCSIANLGTTAFEGSLGMGLFYLDGKAAATIQIKENITLNANSYFSSGLVFSTTGLNLEPGTYLLALMAKRKTDSGYGVLAAYKDAGGTYPNLIRVVVSAPALLADKFEPNDKETQPATLPVSFAGSTASVTSEGANLHVTSDLDYYKLDLPTGYSYELKARVHDSDNAGNGKAYGADVLFSYKVGSGSYSTVSDVSVNDNNDVIKLTNGGTILFKVGPYFSGEQGTYLLDIQVSRQAPAFITMVSPKAGDKWFTTTTQAITWTDNITENVKIDLLRGAGNTFVQTIATSVPSSGQYTWTIPDGLPDATDYKIAVTSVTTGSVQSISGAFSLAKLVLGTEDPTVTLSPNPTAGLLTIQAAYPLPYHTVFVLNSRGQQVVALTNQASANRLTVDLSGQPAGIYVVKLLGDNDVRTHKISLIR